VRKIAAAEQAIQSRDTIRSYTRPQVVLRDRLFDWLRYPVQRRAFQKLLEGKFQGFPWLAAAWADYRALEAEREALALAVKKWPAADAAARVREMGKRRAEAERRAKANEFLVNYYESLFPWLEEFRGEEVEELLVAELGESESIEGADDPARRWLSPVEYESLPAREKYQRALDRYWSKKKSRWEIGRDYERYIGYKYETVGYAVHYHGIVEGFADLGPDLIASKGDDVEIVQCKCWSQDKVIHEKHIFQLFGTVFAYKMDNPGLAVTGKFVTSTCLSDRAKQFAAGLEIGIDELQPLERYPCVKCNVSRRSGEKIYHLPFDQQYDSTIVEEERLEHFVSTVAEAEALGFRRAYRWRGQAENANP